MLLLVRTNHMLTETLHTVRDTLNEIRLREDLTYAELANAIGLREPSSIYKFLNCINSGIQDRTLYKIHRYLDRQAKPKARRRA
jgi:transcriptional regulator with XRE-family HTH domain